MSRFSNRTRTNDDSVEPRTSDDSVGRRSPKRSPRRYAGLTAAVAGGAALVAVPTLTGFTSSSPSATPTAKDVASTREAPAHHIAYPADPTGLGREMLPTPPKPKPVVTPKATTETNGSERASRSTSRSQLSGSSSSSGSSGSGSGGSGRSASSGSPKAIAQAMLADRGWSGQFSCLNSLWTKESGWRTTADNPSSDAYGIPQALPGSKMATAGSDWRTNPATQIEWGLDYIADVYGTPCAAWSHSQANNWY